VQYAADLKKFGADAQPLNSKAVALGLEDAKHGAPAQAKAAGRVPEANRAASKLKAANSINRKVPAWREVLWARLVHVKSKWLDHAAVAALSGARPAELETAQIQRVGNDLRITLNGAKVSSTKGQPWRSMLIKNDGGSEFAHLFAKANNGQTVIGLPKDVTDYPDAFSAALARAGKSCFPAKTERMSGYVYRHSFASDLKADGFAKNDIAAALGHAVTKTQDTYGRAVGGKAGARSLSVTCARQIKQTHDTRYTSGPAVDITSVSSAPQTVTFSTPSFESFGL
jgi:integrase